MTRIVGVLGLAAILLSAAASEVRTAEPQNIAGWGRVVDPVGDCGVAEKPGALAITVPGAYRDLVAFEKLKNTQAPRVMFSVEGDFTLRVTARKFALPQPKSSASADNPTSYVGGGLVVWQDAENFVRLQRAANGDGKRIGNAPFIHANQFSGGKPIANIILPLPADEDTHLRIDRRFGKLALAYSQDGKAWTAVEMTGAPQALTDPVQAGVFVINSTNRAITHELADLRMVK